MEKDTPSLERRIVELEVKLTYQDQLIAELNDVVIDLRADLERLAAKAKRVEEQLDAGVTEDLGNVPPPHY